MYNRKWSYYPPTQYSHLISYLWCLFLISDVYNNTIKMTVLSCFRMKHCLKCLFQRNYQTGGTHTRHKIIQIYNDINEYCFMLMENFPSVGPSNGGILFICQCRCVDECKLVHKVIAYIGRSVFHFIYSALEQPLIGQGKERVSCSHYS